MTALALITLACSARGVLPRAEPAMIASENQAFSDMTVYVRDTGGGDYGIDIRAGSTATLPRHTSDTTSRCPSMNSVSATMGTST